MATILSNFYKHLKYNPNNTPLYFDNTPITYKQLNDLSNKIATLLEDKNLVSEVIPIHLDKSKYLVASMLACWKLNKAYTILDKPSPFQLLQFIKKETNALVVIDDEFIKDIQTIKKVKQYNTINNPDSLAAVVYTSGTTSNPKGVMISHNNFMMQSKLVIERFYKPYKGFLLISTLSFMLGQVNLLLSFIYNEPVYILPNNKATDIRYQIDYIQKHKIEASFYPPQLLSIFLQYADGLLKSIVTASDIASNIYSDKTILYNSYGITETIALLTFFKVNKLYEQVPIGKLLDGYKLYLVDEKYNLIDKPNQVGEMLIGGNISKGYYNNEELTNEKFISNPFSKGKVFRSSDLAYYNENKDLVYYQRKDFMFNIRGQRVEPTQIEQAIRKLEGIKDVVVKDFDISSISNIRNDKSIYAGIVIDKDISIDSIQKELRKHLKENMIPSVYNIIDNLPLTKRNKLDRKNAIPSNVLELYKRVNNKIVKPTNKAEEDILDIVSKQINIKKTKISIDDNLLSLGFNSLSMANLIYKIGNKNLSFTNIVTNSTIRNIATQVNIKQENIFDIISYKPQKLYKLKGNQFAIYIQEAANQNQTSYNNPFYIKLNKDKTNTKDIINALEKTFITHPYLLSTIISKNNVQYLKRDDNKPLVVQTNKGNIDINKLIRPFIKDKEFYHINLFNKPNYYYLFIDLHHIVFDGTSINQFFKTFIKYLSNPNQQVDNINELSFATNIYEDKIDKKPLSNFYKQLFYGTDQDIELNTYNIKKNNKKLIDTYNFKIGNNPIKDMANKNNITQNILLLYIFSKALTSFSNTNNNISLSLVVDPQRYPSTDIGMKIKTLPISINIDKDKNFEDTLKDIFKTYNNVLQNDLYTLLDMKQDIGFIPNIAYVFRGDTFQKDNFTNEKIKDIGTIENKQSSNIGKFDLSFQIDGDSNDKQFDISIEYKTNKYSKEFIKLLSTTYKTIIDNLNDNIKNKDILSISPNEKKQLTSLFDKSLSQTYKPQTIQSLFEKQVLLTPNNIALIYGNIKLTYNELNDKANIIANYLIDNYNIIPDSLISLLLNRSQNIIIAILAVLKSGAAYVPISPSNPKQRIDYIIKDTDPKVLLDDDKVDKILKQNSNTSNPKTNSTPQNLAYVIYTSGTTGNPKGVMVEHKGVGNLIESLHSRYNLSNNPLDETILFMTNYTFDVSIEQIFLSLLYSHKLVITKDKSHEDIKELLEYININNITHLSMVPSVLSLFDNLDIKTLKRIVIAGEGFSNKLVGEHINKPYKFINAFGPTEATDITTTHKYNDKDKENTIGTPIDNTSIYILDKDLNILPKGAIGTVYIGGIGLARGYLNNKELTNKKFIPNPYQSKTQKQLNLNDKLYNSGDLARINKDNQIEFIGRDDDQVKIRGFRIELGEIEQVAQTYSNIDKAIAIAKDNQIVLYYVSNKLLVGKTGDSTEDTNIRTFLQSKLPDYMIPSFIIPITKIPLTQNGKLNKKALPQIDSVNKDKQIIKPINNLETQLLDVFSSTLNINKQNISTLDNFFHLGGDSIKAIGLSNQIRNKLDKQISISDIFELKTIKDISTYLSTKTNQISIYETIKDNKATLAPLSYGQQSLYIINQLEQNKTNAYNIPYVIKLNNNIDIESIKKALKQIVIRHKILRTVYVKDKDQNIIQKILSKPLPITQLVVKTSNELKSIIQSHFNHKFLLDSQYPINVLLIKHKLDNYLSIVFHHIASDGFSSQIFSKELILLYKYYNQKQTLYPLKPLPIQYIDYAIWQRQNEKQINLQLSFYKEQLQEVENLSLPLDKRRPKVFDFKGNTIPFIISPNIVTKLKKIALKGNITLFTLLLYTYYILLRTYSSQSNFTIGFPIARRHIQNIDKLIGYFVNTIAIKVEETNSIANDIKALQEKIIKIQDNQDIDFEKVVNELKVDKDLSINPIFQAMFVYQNFQDDIGQVKSIATPYYISEQLSTIAKFDITLSLQDNEDNSIQGSFEYAISLFDETTIKQMISSYISILNSLSSIDINKKQIKDITTTKDSQDIISTFDKSLSNRTYIPQTIQSLFEKQVLLTPNNISIVYEDIKLTYAELNEKANIIANYLIDNYKIVPDDLISLLLNRSQNMIIAILGVLKSGAAYVPISPTNPKQRIDYIIKDTNSKVLLDDKLVDKILKQNSNSSNPKTNTTPDNLAYVIYTSGTTGNPKGVMVEHKGVGNLVQSLIKRYEFSKNNEKILFLSNYVFDASIEQIFLPLFTGDTTIVTKDNAINNITEFENYVNKNKVTYINSTSSILELLNFDNLKTIKTISSAGERLTESLLNKIRDKNFKFTNAYGPTEDTACSALYRFSENETTPNTIGTPIDNTSIYILDKNLKLLPKGAIGTLYMGGIGLARGYLNNKELTNKRFIPNPYQTKTQKQLNLNDKLYNSGDLARINKDNQIVFIGRGDDQVKIRGFRIELGEIEQVVLLYPNIDKAIAITKDNQIILYYKSIINTISNENIIEHLQSKLPDYMIPSFIIPITKIPLTQNGKLNKKVLPQIDTINKDKQIIKPTNNTETQLLDIFCYTLNINKQNISTSDNFFHLGGDSIKAIGLSNQIRNKLDKQISISNIFELKTIKDISNYLSTKTNKHEIIKDKQYYKGKIPLLPIQKQFFSNLDKLKDYNHYNQAFVLNLPKDIDKQKLTKSLIKLWNYHDMLRAYYKKQNNSYFQYMAPFIKDIKINYIDATNIDKYKVNEALSKVQSSFDIFSAYNLYSITLIKDETSYFLHFAFHHLIIDAVSWRIIADSLGKLYNNQPLQDKLSSYKNFADYLYEYSCKNNQNKYFEKVNKNIGKYNKTLSSLSNNTLTQNIISFSKDTTYNLLYEANKTYSTHINDILLTCLSNALSKITKQDENFIAYESYGRDEITNRININNTIGWFTTLYPLPIHNNLIDTKENIRYIKDNGISYGVNFSYSHLPLIVFNYLGHFENSNNSNTFELTQYLTGSQVSSKNKQEDIIALNGAITNDKLSFSLTTYLREDIKDIFIKEFKAQVNKLIDELSNEKRQYLTPFDTNNIVDTKTLDKLQKTNEIEAIYKANALQEGFIYHSLNQGDKDDAYIVDIILEYNEPINKAIFQRTWNLASDKFPSLRLNLLHNPNLLQIVNKTKHPLFKYIDISKDKNKDKAIEDLIDTNRHTPFKLDKDPLLRIYLIKKDINNYIVIISSHHSIIDGWSNPILFSFVDKTYKSLINDKQVKIQEELTYLKAQRYLQDNKNKTIAFYNKYLEDAQDETNLSHLLKKQVDLSNYKHIIKPKQKGVTLDNDLYDDTVSFASKNNVTISTILQYAFHKLLQIYSDADKTILGITVSGRDIPIQDIDKSVGLYINTLPVYVEHNKSVIDTLDKLQKDVININQNSNQSLASLQREGKRLFSSLFVFENYPLGDTVGNNSISIVKAIEKLDYPLSMIAYESNKSIGIELKYAGELFYDNQIEIFLEQIKTIVSQIVQYKPIDITKDKQEIINVFDKSLSNRTYIPQTIQSLFEKQVTLTPNNISLVYEDVKLTYSELNDKANIIANYLIDNYNIVPDDLISLLLNRSQNMIIAILGVLKSGAAYVPISPSNPKQRIDYIIKNTNSKVLLDDNKVDKILQENDNTSNPKTNTTPQNLAYVIYTSGTTDNPKGVMVEHKGVGNLVQSLQSSYNLNEEDIKSILFLSNYVFDASIEQIFLTLLKGRKLVISMDDLYQDQQLFENYLNKNEVSFMSLTSLLSQSINFSNIKTLKKIMLGGDALTKQTLNRLSNRTFTIINAYGPTEVTVMASTHIYSKNDTTPNTIGTPIDNTSIYILDKNLKLLPKGAIGTLYIGGIGLARGYLNNKELTNKRFIPNPYQTKTQKQLNLNDKLYNSGDLARINKDNQIVFIGRRDDQVNIRGFRIELGEIEQVALLYPNIDKAIAITKDNQIILYYKSIINTISNENIIEHLQSKLPDYMIPSFIIPITKIPLTQNGKLNKKALPQIDTINKDKQIIKPTNKQETQLLDIFSLTLNINKQNISTIDNFFHLGGDSIKVIGLSNQIINKLDKQISISNIFELKTIKDISNYLSTKTNQISIYETIKDNKATLAPLSYGQQSLYIINQLEQNKTNAYNIPYSIKLNNNIDIESIKKALKQIVIRHKILRTVYVKDKEQNIIQKILSKPLPIKQLTAKTSNELKSIIQSHFNHKFLLDSQYPINVLFIRHKLDNYLSIVFHHIASDGFSSEIFSKELISLYKYYKQKQTLYPLKPLPIQYIDYAIWQRGNEKKINLQLSFYKKQLQEVENLSLPLDKRRPKVFDFKGNTIPFIIPPNIATKLKKIALDNNITSFTLLIYTYYILLRTYSSQSNFTIGFPIARRHIQNIDKLIGYFVNTIAIKVEETNSIANDIKVLQEKIIKIQDNQDIDFERIVNELKVDKDLSINPIFQAMFVYQNFQDDIDQVKSIATPYYISEQLSTIAKFDITLSLQDNKDNSIQGSIEYATSLFDETTIKQIINSYISILTSLCSIDINNKQIKDITTTKDSKDIINTFDKSLSNRTYKPKTIQSLFEKQVLLTPYNISIVYEDIKLTYAELNEKANIIANYLIDNYKIVPDDLISLLLNRSQNMIIAILGVLKSGAAYVPISPNNPKQRIDYIIKDTDSKVLLDDEIVNKILSNYSNTSNPKTNTTFDNLAYVIYTSGTTGNPKGVMVEHKGVGNLIESLHIKYSLSNNPLDETILFFANYTFDVSVEQIFLSLLYSHKLVITKEKSYENINKLLEYINTNNITHLAMVPSFLSLFDNLDIKTLKRIVVAGEGFSNKLVEEHINKPYKFINAYGPTEATDIITTHKYNDKDKENTIGTPIDNTSIYVLDKNLNILPKGAIGTLYIGGIGLARGYLNNNKLTQQKFIPNPYQSKTQKQLNLNDKLYNSGDLARINNDNQIVFIGRGDDQVKIRGFRLELGEIETIALTHPNISNAVIIAKNGQIILYYKPTDNVKSFEFASEDNATNIRQYLQSKLPDYMVPSLFIRIDNIPLTVNGKIDKKALPQPKILKVDDFVAPKTKMEKELVDIFAKVLKMSSNKISVTDNFFSLGGNSILSIMLVRECIKKGYEISYEYVFKYKTPQKIAISYEENIDTLLKISYSDNFKDKYDKILKNHEEFNLNLYDIGNVLLTGTTGFLGIHILENFLNNELGNIYCIVREKGEISAENRLKSLLFYYFEKDYKTLFNERIHIIEGDIRDKSTFDKCLDYPIDTLINAAANVHHFTAGREIKDVNIKAVINSIDFAKKTACNLVHVSTMSVAGMSLDNVPPIDTEFDETMFYIGQNLDNEYVYSKFKGEELILNSLLKSEINAKIMRVGNLMARSEDGVFQMNFNENAFINLLKSFSVIGKIPHEALNSKIELSPIDNVSKAILLLSKTHKNHVIFHPFNNHHLKLKNIIKVMEDLNFKVKESNMEDFNVGLKNVMDDESKVLKVSGIIQSLNRSEIPISVVNDYTTEILHRLDFNWNRITNEYLYNFLKYLKDLNFFN